MEKKYIKFIEKMAEDLDLNFEYQEEDNSIWLETWTDQGEDFIINIESDNLHDLESEFFDLYSYFDEYEDAEEMGQCRGAPDLRTRIESSKQKKEIYEQLYYYVKEANKK